MKGNPEIAHDRCKVSTRMRETVTASQIAKLGKCDVCDAVGETSPVQLLDGIFNLCKKCIEGASKGAESEECSTEQI